MQSLDLPRPIANYFAADEDRAETLSQCFTEDAVVKDEGQTYNGRAAIKEWKAHASEKYQYTSEPLALDQADRKAVVTSRLTGNFCTHPAKGQDPALIRNLM